MRILVLSVNYWPEETGIGPLTTWRCEYLASVVTTSRCVRPCHITHNGELATRISVHCGDANYTME